MTLSRNRIEAGLKLAGLANTVSLEKSLELFGGEVAEDDDALFLTLDVISFIGFVASVIQVRNDEVRDFELRKLDPVLKALRNAQAAAEAAEDAGETMRVVPVSQLRSAGRALDTTASLYLRSTAPLIEQLELIKIQTRKINEAFDRIEKFLDVFEKLGNLADVVALAVLFAQAVIDEDEAQTQAVQAAFLRDTGGETEEGAETFALELPEGVDARVEAAFAALNARGSDRADRLLAARQAIVDAKDAAAALAPDGAEAFAESIDAALGRVAALFDTLDLFDDLRALSGVANVLGSVAKVLKIALDAIQPVLDLFGPVLSIINKVLDKIESALQLDKLEQLIRDKAEDQIDALLAPILAQMQELLDALALPELGLIDTLLSRFEDFRRLVDDLALDPFAQVAEDGDDAVLDREAVAVGDDRAETVSLTLDPRFDDGWGGFAFAGAGDDAVAGTALADMIFGGAGDDEIRGLAGHDLLFGGPGADRLFGDEGDDALDGGEGDDLLVGGPGDDQLFGGGGADRLLGGEGNDRLEGGEGDDTLEGGAGDDQLFGDAGEDLLVDGAGRSTLDGGEGLDRIVTLGDADAEHLILDPTAVLVGGAGRDHVRLGDAYAPGTVVPDGVSFDGGANRDLFETGSLDLIALAPRIANFETLRITTPEGGAVLVADPASLSGFERLELGGAGAATLRLSGGAFDADMLFDDRPFRIDLSGLPTAPNPEDGPLAGVEDRPAGSVAALTFVMDETVGTLTGFRATSLGMTFVGSDAADVIVGGGGPDLIRPGLGADLIDLRAGAPGDRFELDGAVGDVIRGSAAELDGDLVLGLANRLDRVRVEGSTAAEVSFEIAGDRTLARIGEAVIAFDGVFEKMLARDGDGHVEILSNNVPPTAVADDFAVVTGGPSLVFDPTDNDVDPDDLTGLGVVLDSAEYDMLTGFGGLADGQEIVTELGNVLRREGDALVYLPRLPAPVFRAFEAGDGAVAGFVVGELRGAGKFDPTEDVPFFGFDRILYRVRDAEGELSNVSAMGFLVAPYALDPVTGRPDYGSLPRIEVEGVDRVAGTSATVEARFTTIIEALGAGAQVFGAERPFFDGDEGPLPVSIYGEGNDFFVVNVPGGEARAFGRSGNDAMVALAGDAFLGGGANADWLQGGPGNDLLIGGGVEDLVVLPALRLDLPATDPARLEGFLPDVALSGAGDNVLSASLYLDDYEQDRLFPREEARSRDTVFVLEGDKDIVTGPMVASGARAAFAEYFGLYDTAIATRALQDDVIRGFDRDDEILLPLDTFSFLSGVTRGIGSRSPQPQAFIPQRDGLLLTTLDLTDRVGDGLDQVLGIRGTEFGARENLFPQVDFDTLFTDSTFIGAPGAAGGTVYFKNASFNGFPAIVTYGLEADALADDGGANPSTLLTLSLKAFRIQWGPDLRFPSVGAKLAKDFGLLSTAEFPDPVTPLLPVAELVPDADLTFSIRLDGVYRDRFVLDAVATDLPAAAPWLTTEDVGTRYADPGKLYEYVRDTSGLLGLAIRYVSAPPETAPDAVTVRRGDSVLFDVTANDLDADGDALFAPRLLDVDPALLDGDLANGELTQAIDPVSGFGAGRFVYTAPAEFVGEVRFRYVASDGEFESAPEDVTITVTGLPPAPGDDVVTLPFDTDGVVSWAALLANDADPDGEPLDGFAPVLTGAAAFAPVTVPADALPEGAAGLPAPGAPDLLEIGRRLSPEALAALRAAPVSADGAPGAEAVFAYELEDAAGAGLSDAATVRVQVAAPLTLGSPGPRSVAEDGTLSVDLLAGRAGGFGAAEIVSVTVGGPIVTGAGAGVFGPPPAGVVGDAPAVEVFAGASAPAGFAAGAVSLDGGVLTFQPLPDLFGVDVAFEVTIRDALGSTATTAFAVTVTPSPDGPEVRGGPFATDEDAPLAGLLTLWDPDALDPATLGAEAVAAALATAPEAPFSALGAAAAAVAPQPAATGPIVTRAGGELTLTPTGTPTVFAFLYAPAPDHFGADSAVIDLVGGGSVEVRFDVAPVNDAPVAAPEPLRVIQTGGATRYDLAALFADVDGAVDLDTLRLDSVPDPVLATVALDDAGGLTLTGVAPGTGAVGVSVADDLGLRSAVLALEFRVNAAPVAATDRALALAPGETLRIDAIANDSDAEGPVDYVRGEDRLPRALDPGEASGDETARLLGAASWSEAEGAFVYVAPDDPSLAGRSDVFLYEIEDADGAITRGVVTIDLAFPQAEPQLRLGEATASLAVESFLIGAGEGPAGTAAELDGDELLDFGPGDALTVTDLDPDATTVSIVRDRAPRPAAPVPDLAAPTPAGLFGTASTEVLLDAFVGDTLLTLSDGVQSATLRLLGAFVGTFSLDPAPGGGVTLRYAPTAAGDGDLSAGASDADLRGGDGDGRQLGGPGDDVLRPGAGADALDGGPGADALFGGPGVKTMRGGADADLFVLTETGASGGPAPVRLEDFDPAQGDRLALSIAAYLNDDLTPALDLLRVETTRTGFLLLGAADPEDPEAGGWLPLAEVVAAPPPPPVTLVQGGAGRDALVGTDGPDRIEPGAGSGDRMTGLGGDDDFVFRLADAANGVREQKTILDFEVGADTLVLLDGLEIAAFRKVSAGALVELSGGDRDLVTIRGAGIETVDDLFRTGDPDLLL